MNARVLLVVSALACVGCYEHHSVGARLDSDVRDSREREPDSGVAECDLSGIECIALPGCLGPSPPETTYCDAVRICLFSDPGDAMAMAIDAVADRIECHRADSCDFLCNLTVGPFDDEVRSELCAVVEVAPEAQIECAIFGP